MLCLGKCLKQSQGQAGRQGGKVSTAAQVFGIPCGESREVGDCLPPSLLPLCSLFTATVPRLCSLFCLLLASSLLPPPCCCSCCSWSAYFIVCYQKDKLKNFSVAKLPQQQQRRALCFFFFTSWGTNLVSQLSSHRIRRITA